MTPTSRLYNALNDFLRQCDVVWQDARHLKTLCWMMIGMLQSQNVHRLGVWCVCQKPRSTVSVAPETVPALVVESTHRCCCRSSCPDQTSPVPVAKRTPLSEPRYNRGVELFLHRLGRGGLSGQNDADCLASRHTMRQQDSSFEREFTILSRLPAS